MRPMTVLASALFPSLLLATLQVGCSSDDNSTTTQTPFDSGGVTVPEAAANPGTVTITVVGKGYVVSADGVQQDGGPNGFVGADGGAPTIDCATGATGANCTAAQGTTLYAYPSPANVFLGWSVAGNVISTDTNIVITSGVGSPLTATFGLPGSGGVDAGPSPPADSGAGG